MEEAHQTTQIRLSKWYKINVVQDQKSIDLAHPYWTGIIAFKL